MEARGGGFGVWREKCVVFGFHCKGKRSRLDLVPAVKTHKIWVLAILKLGCSKNWCIPSESDLRLCLILSSIHWTNVDRLLDQRPTHSAVKPLSPLCIVNSTALHSATVVRKHLNWQLNRGQFCRRTGHSWFWQAVTHLAGLGRGVGQPFHNLVVQHQPPQCTKTAQCAASGFYRLPFTGFCHFLQFRSLYPTHTVSRSQYPSEIQVKWMENSVWWLWLCQYGNVWVLVKVFCSADILYTVCNKYLWKL